MTGKVPFPWNDTLLTKVRVIDEQHQQLFTEVNNLIAAAKKHQGQKVLGKFLDYIESYMAEHFAAEEDLMDMLGSTHKAEHTGEHRKFSKRMTELRSEIKVYDTASVFRVATYLISWLTDHIPNHDQPLANWMRKMS